MTISSILFSLSMKNIDKNWHKTETIIFFSFFKSFFTKYKKKIENIQFSISEIMNISLYVYFSIDNMYISL